MKKLLSGILVVFLSFSYLFSFEAHADDVTNQKNKLETPVLHWVDESSLVLSWDAVEHADNYYIVAKAEGTNYIYSWSGYTQCQLDIEQLVSTMENINQVSLSGYVIDVEVTAKTDYSSPESLLYYDSDIATSSRTYTGTSEKIKLTTPALQWADGDSLVLSWDAVEHADSYFIVAQADGTNYIYSWSGYNQCQLDIVQLVNAMENIYQTDLNGYLINVRVTAKSDYAGTDSSLYYDSDEATTSKIYVGASKKTKLSTPSLQWVDDEPLTLKWDAVEHADNYYIVAQAEGTNYIYSWSGYNQCQLDIVQLVSAMENIYQTDLNEYVINVEVTAKTDYSGTDSSLYYDSDKASTSKTYIRPMIIRTEDGIEVVQTNELFNILKNSLSEEQQVTATGKELEFDFKIADLSETSEGAPEIKAYADNNSYTIGKYFDLSLAVKADGTSIGTVTATAATIPIVVDVPTDMQKSGRTFIILRNHNGAISEVGRGTGTKVNISTSEFSIYAIAYSDSLPVPSDEESSSVLNNHEHSFEWTYDADGDMIYMCKECGAVSGNKIPASLYAKFQEETTRKIKIAVGKLTINTDTWMSFHKAVIEELSLHPDVELTVQYRYGGKRYSTTIPAGYDVKSMLNDDGYVGFLYLNKLFGRTEI